MLYGLDLTFVRRVMQGGLTVGIDRVGIRSGPQKNIDHFRTTVQRRIDQCCIADIIACFEIAARYKKSHHVLGAGEGSARSGQKNTIFFEDVRVPASCLVGGENNGWKVASTHLEVEHSGQGNIRANPIWIALLAWCRTHNRDGGPLIEDPDVRARLAEIFSRLEAVRLLSTRNFWMVYAGEKRSYEGSQVSYLRKTTNLWLTKAILDLLGPEALTSDPVLGAVSGLAEAQQRRGIVEQHPGGTTDIQRVVIARRLGVGAREPQQAGRLGEEGMARKTQSAAQPVEA